MAQPINVAVRCPKCNWRVMDKISPTTGKIEIKCPRCHRVVAVSYTHLDVYKRQTLPWQHKEDEGQNRRRDLPWNRIDKGLLPFAAIMERRTP